MLKDFRESIEIHDLFKINFDKSDTGVSVWVSHISNDLDLYFNNMFCTMKTIDEANKVIKRFKTILESFVSILKLGQDLRKKYEDVEIDLDRSDVSYIHINNCILKRYSHKFNVFDRISICFANLEFLNNSNIKIELNSSISNLCQGAEYFVDNYRVLETVELDADTYTSESRLKNNFEIDCSIQSIDDIHRLIEDVILIYKRKSKIYQILELR